MEQIKIYNPDNTEWGWAPITANSKHVVELMKTNEVNLEWNDIKGNMIPCGSYVIFQNTSFYLYAPYYPESKDLGKYTYKPSFKHEICTLAKMPFMLHVSDNQKESDWNYNGYAKDIATPLMHAIYDSIGKLYAVSFDDGLGDRGINLSFTNMTVLGAINAIAEQLNCEWKCGGWSMVSGEVLVFTNKVIDEGGASETLSLTAGEDLDYPNINDKAEYYNRFYIFGSTRNISQDYQGANANTVINKRLTLDPDIHPNGYIDLPKFDADGNIVTTAEGGENARAFYDEDGHIKFYVVDDSVLTGRIYSKVVQLDDIYPRADLHIKKIAVQKRYVRDNNDKKVEIDGGYATYNVFYVLLVDSNNNPFAFNPKTYPDGNVLKNLAPMFHFKSGALQGREFEVQFYEESTTIRDEVDGSSVAIDAGMWRIKYIEDNTIIIPGAIAPKIGDEIIVFNISMPQSYIAKGYKDLETTAMREIYELSKDGNEYTCKSNQVRFATADPLLKVGRHVHLYIGNRKIDTRVCKLSVCLDRSCEQEISFSKALRKGAISTILTTVESTKQEVIQTQLIDDSQRKQQQKNIYDAQREAIGAMFDNSGQFDKPINPLRIETAMIQVGSKANQFQLYNVLFHPNFDGLLEDKNWIYVDSNNGKLVHFGLGDYIYEWNVLSNGGKQLVTDSVYYIYAKAVRYDGEEHTGNNCTIVFDTEQRQYDSDSSNYYFLLGTLSSVINGERRISLAYGTTTISGRIVSTGIIKSNDGETYFDLDKGEIGGNITFKAGTATSKRIDKIEANASEAKEEASNAQSTANSAAEKAALAMFANGDNLFSDQFLIDFGTYTIVPPTHGKVIVHNGRDMFFGNLIPINQSHDYIIEYWAKLVAGSIKLNASLWWNTADTAWYGYGEQWTNEIERRSDGWAKYRTNIIVKHPDATGGKVYFQIDQDNPGDTEYYIADVVVLDATINNLHYLEKAMQDATKGTTQINGGLLLSQFIAVKNSQGNMTAGMSGEDNNDDAIMFWAGDWNKGTADFRVLKSGKVVMNDAEIGARTGKYNVKIGNGYYSIIDTEIGETLTKIVPEIMCTIDNAVSAGSSTTSGRIPEKEITNAYNVTISGTSYMNTRSQLITISEQTILSGSHGSGVASVKPFIIEGTLSAIENLSNEDWYQANIGVRIYVNDELIDEQHLSSPLEESSRFKTASVAMTSKDIIYPFITNEEIKIKLSLFVEYRGATYNNGNVQLYWSHAKNSNADWTISISNYANIVFADGLCFSQQNNRYFGISTRNIDQSATGYRNGELFRAICHESGLQLTRNGFNFVHNGDLNNVAPIPHIAWSGTLNRVSGNNISITKEKGYLTVSAWRYNTGRYSLKVEAVGIRGTHTLMGQGYAEKTYSTTLKFTFSIGILNESQQSDNIYLSTSDDNSYNDFWEEISYNHSTGRNAMSKINIVILDYLS